jgi:YVTN family beta-propeller protein
MSITDDFLYVSSFTYPRISIIDLKTDKDVGFITTSSGIMAVKAVPEKNKIYAAPFESGGIDVYALSTKLLIKTISLPNSEITIQTSSNQPYGQRSDLHFLTGGWSLDYNPTKELLYVADYNSNLVYVIDGKTDEVIQSIPVSRHPFTVKADPISNTVMVASLAGNEITFLDDLTGPTSVKPIHEITKTIKLSGGPWGLDIDPIRHNAYVTNRGCECITVINILEKEVMDTIPLGDKAQVIAVDTSEHQIYASYLTQNKIVKIDGNTNQIVSSWNVESKPWSITINPSTHNFYTALASEDAVLVMGPESFSITLPVVTMQSPSAYVGMLSVHTQDVQASDSFLDVEKTLLTMNIESEDGGRMIIIIPRNILDSQKGGTDTLFDVIIDSKTTTHEEYTGDASGRIISVIVPKNSENITIVGTGASYADESLQSPATDVKIIPKDIICKDKVWIENAKGKLVCTTPETAKKLVERGWGTILE